MAEQQQGEELAQVVEDGFRQLLASQLVERAPPCDLPPPIEKVHSTAVVGLASQVPRQHQMTWLLPRISACSVSGASFK